MEQKNVRKTIAELEAWMEQESYSSGYIGHYRATTKKLLCFMDAHGIADFQIDVGFCFLKETYGYDLTCPERAPHNSQRRVLEMLAEFQLHGVPLKKVRTRNYTVPPHFQEATERFLANRRFQGIIERNMTTQQLYLERFFGFLNGKQVCQIPQITGAHIIAFLRSLCGFSDATKSHTLRTTRQFMTFCFQNGYHPLNLSSYAPNIQCEKRARLPSVYTKEEIDQLLLSIDRSNPVGKRNYAMILLIVKLGMRSGDVCNLKFENIDWEQNKVKFTQHKTCESLTLPLLEDVGLAMIDYLQFARPKSDSQSLFLRHRSPITPCTASGVYSFVSCYLSKMDFPKAKRKHGPHALRHSLASRLLEGNIPLPVISAILGHTSSDTTAVYLSIDIDKLRLCALEV